MAFAIYTDGGDDHEDAVHGSVAAPTAVAVDTCDIKDRASVPDGGVSASDTLRADGCDSRPGNEYGWELSKENVKPLRRGRNASKLGERLGPRCSSGAGNDGCGSAEQEASTEQQRACVQRGLLTAALACMGSCAPHRCSVRCYLARSFEAAIAACQARSAATAEAGTAGTSPRDAGDAPSPSSDTDGPGPDLLQLWKRYGSVGVAYTAVVRLIPRSRTCRYIAWVEATFPSGGGSDGRLLPLLERATRDLHSRREYRNSVDHVALWVQYVSSPAP